MCSVLYPHCKGDCLLLLQYCAQPTKRTCIKGLEWPSLFMWKWIPLSKGQNCFHPCLYVARLLGGKQHFPLHLRGWQEEEVHERKFTSRNNDIKTMISEIKVLAFNLHGVQRDEYSWLPTVEEHGDGKPLTSSLSGLFEMRWEGRVFFSSRGHSLNISIDATGSLQHQESEEGTRKSLRIKRDDQKIKKIHEVDPNVGCGLS